MPNERTPHDRAARDRPRRDAERDRLRRVRGERRLVAAPAPVRPVRAHRLLRHLAVTARERARGRRWAPGHPQLRAGGGLVWSYETNEFYESGPALAPPDTHPADQPVPGPSGLVPRDWSTHLH